MQASAVSRATLQGTPLSVSTPARTNKGCRTPLDVQAYKKGGGKVKGGYNGSEPNAKKKFCKTDSSGQKNKGLGAYRFTNKYGDINDYSPIYDEYTWAGGGDVYALGPKGLTAWGALLAAGLAVSVYLVVITANF